MTSIESLLADADLDAKMARLTAAFDREFGVLSSDEKIVMLCQFSTHLAAIFLTDAVQSTAKESLGRGLSIMEFLVAMEKSSYRVSVMFAELMHARVSHANTEMLKYTGGGGKT